MRYLLWLVIIVLPASITIAETNLYLADSLRLQLAIDGDMELVATASNAQAERLETELLLVPENNFRQKVLSINTTGEVKPDKILFTWNNPSLGKKEFGYSALLETVNRRKEVRSKIAFPVSSVAGYEQYLLSTETIDSNNPAIIAKATELVEGEDDLFKAVFKLASWVEENVNYNLSTLTAETSQQASWVLQNRQGVCDEMTSLFVAMARAVGIPARFVSGVSYTTSDLFAEPWQPHGWAEVYFPDIGWVSFDITFGEYGYIDVTHIKLRDGFDPKDAATRYQWTGHKVDLATGNLALEVQTTYIGSQEPDAVQLTLELTAEQVDFGSYNVIKGIIKNNAEYYAASTLQLALPPELELPGSNKRTILLGPKEVKETFWTVRVPEELDRHYIYTFPIILYNEKNVSVSGNFQAEYGKASYSREEAGELSTVNEEKSYSRKISSDCDYPEELQINQSSTVSCTIMNSGNTNLENVTFCIEEKCNVVSLPINQRKTLSITVVHSLPGWKTFIVSAENELIEKRSTYEYVVVDNPSLKIEAEYPSEVEYGNIMVFSLTLKKISFSEPQQVAVAVKGLGQEQRWEIDSLREDMIIAAEWSGSRLASKNHFEITATWKDAKGDLFIKQQEILIHGKPINFLDRLKMVWNRIINFVS